MTTKHTPRSHKLYEHAARVGQLEAERDRLRAALINMTALADNMRKIIEGSSTPTVYDIPYGYFNAAYVAIEQAQSFQK